MLMLAVTPADKPWLEVVIRTVRQTARLNGRPTPPIVPMLERLIAELESDVDEAERVPFPEPVEVLAHRFDHAAELLGVSRRTLDRLVAEGELPAILVRSQRRIARDDLVSYVEARRAEVGRQRW